MAWEDKTEGSKDVPSVEDLIKFVQRKADNPLYAEKSAAPNYQADKRPHKPQHAKYKGSAHVAVSQPAKQPVQQQAPQPVSNQNYRSPSTNKGAQHKSKGSSYPPCRYTCPICNDNHYAFSCSAFKGMSVAQRKEHVRVNTLCLSYLKPGHAPADCRSNYLCKVCNGSHNTMIHVEEAAGNPHSVSGTVNHATTSSNDTLDKHKLLMTCQVLVTGPTGKSMPVRALLDSGADVSVITTKAARNLCLKKLNTTVAVAAYGDVINEPSCPTTHLTISSFYRKGWSAQVSAVITNKITGSLPRQETSAVRKLPSLQGLQLADPQFDSPVRIGLLLGADIMPDILMLAGPKDSVKTMETVFGWAVMGVYTPDEFTRPKQAAVQLAIEEPAQAAQEEHTTDALVRFWEVEEPAKPVTPFNPEEVKVQEHYKSTHVFIPTAGKYMVTLPKKELDLESRSRALKRFHSNERSLLLRGNWEKFQAVIQEYLSLNHAQPVTEQEMKTPEQDCYYLPMHGVYKESSSTTKLRVVFDASAQSTTNVFLNDTLAVGPSLHPILDNILIKFRTYRVALTGDISKMYREILLSSPDRQLHRFLWRPQLDQPVRDFCITE